MIYRDEWKKLERLKKFVKINAHYFTPAVKIAVILQFYIGYFFINGNKSTFLLITIYILVLMGIHIYFISQHYDLIEEIRKVENSYPKVSSLSSKIDEITTRIVNTTIMIRNYWMYFVFFILLNPPSSMYGLYFYFANLIWCILMTILMLLPEIMLYLSRLKKEEPKVLFL